MSALAEYSTLNLTATPQHIHRNILKSLDLDDDEDQLAALPTYADSQRPSRRSSRPVKPAGITRNVVVLDNGVNFSRSASSSTGHSTLVEEQDEDEAWHRPTDSVTQRSTSSSSFVYRPVSVVAQPSSQYASMTLQQDRHIDARKVSSSDSRVSFEYAAAATRRERIPRQRHSARMSGAGLPGGPVVLEVCSTPVTGDMTFRLPEAGHAVLLHSRIPKMQAGWKAVLTRPSYDVHNPLDERSIEEAELLYEVRREALSKRYDFRLPSGEHTVLTRTSSKSHTFESHDGQRLAWRQESDGGMSLVSLPSAYVLATYKLAKATQQQTRGGSFSVAADLVRGVLEVLPVTAEAASAAAAAFQASRVKRSPSQVSTLSITSTISVGPRLGLKSLAVGLVLPGAFAAASIASPALSVASLRKSEMLGDELTNLGLGSFTSSSTSGDSFERDAAAAVSARSARRQLEDEERRENMVASLGVDLDSVRSRSEDPRPREVPLALVVASLIATLVSRGKA